MLNHFSPVQLRATLGPWPASLLCSWNFPGQTAGVGCLFLLQGIFLIQGSNPQHLLYLLYHRRVLYCWATQEAWNFLSDDLCLFLSSFCLLAFCLMLIICLAVPGLHCSARSASSVWLAGSLVVHVACGVPRLSYPVACRILVPWRGIIPHPLPCKTDS